MTPQEELMKKKAVHYGDIWDCPHAELLIVARMLDKTRRLVQQAYLRQALKDFGDIPAVQERVGNIDAITEDTLGDLEVYIKLLRKGQKGT